MGDRLRYWLVLFILRNIQIGAHCGICGEWMEHELTARYWPYSICEDCEASDG